MAKLGTRISDVVITKIKRCELVKFIAMASDTLSSDVVQVKIKRCDLLHILTLSNGKGTRSFDGVDRQVEGFASRFIFDSNTVLISLN